MILIIINKIMMILLIVTILTWIYRICSGYESGSATGGDYDVICDAAQSQLNVWAVTRQVNACEQLLYSILCCFG